MVPEHLSGDSTADGRGIPTQGIPKLKSGDNTPQTPDNATRESAIPADLIISQPMPTAPASSEPSNGHLYKACPHCGGLPTPHPLSPAHGGQQACSLSVPTSVSSKRSKSRESLSISQRPAASQDAVIPRDSCLHLLLACLSCQCCLVLQGLLEACSLCLHASCSYCCLGCARCCSDLQEAPLEEFSCDAHCHAVLFETCCEPTEMLEFCLECCAICHRS